ncbi:hypothetical protein OC835_003742 [Tilletia horrida]|uniref:Uncharacterized protein n=1 Tax=Tilletia horrida TaxID=155126 RepID=A0AAN6JK23_9BASI|nr:hypothetical protein OC842_003870 [Tilletia horrida]KAK0531251.1 hypothetical protein OC835_003742 [Tilletia horrida]KAK0560279.1 hypothetical protein OC844_003874 [Tilletia horrida]
MSSNNDEQTFSIQPHPATTNDPNDPANNPSASGAHASAAHAAAATVASNNPGPAVPHASLASKLEEPASKEELAARSAELNK